MSSIQIIPLDYSKSFKQLTEKEKLYAYYLNKACWAGIPISSFQISYESPAIFIIFQQFFSSFQNINNLEEIILKSGNISKSEFDYFILYAVHFYSRYGNYSSYGKEKIIPKLSCLKFEAILKLSPKFESFSEIWNNIKNLLYVDTFLLPNISSEYSNEYIVGTYYLNGIKDEEIKMIDEILTKKKILLGNTRLQKIKENNYEVLIASIIEKEEKLEINDKNISITLKYGDFKDYLIKINYYLEKAKSYASNDLEKKLIDLYIEAFNTGDIEIHKESQRVWVKNISPIVEYNLGWIETYIDLYEVRSYYEGIVAIQNKNSTIKYKNLVNNSEYFLSQLPWDKNFEKDKFITPDFIALDIIGFPTTCLFVGINLPNYLDIHETDGFKNIALINVYDKYDYNFLKTFLYEKDVELEKKMGTKTSMFKTALHELLGHGSGKLFKINKSGEYNFNKEKAINPLTKEKINSWYLIDETYETRFKTISRSLEEGRADYIALYLVFDKKAQNIFEFKEEEYEDVIYNMWLHQFIGGITGIGFYYDNKWNNPYCQEKFIFLNYVLKNQNPNKKILSFDVDEINDCFKIFINKKNLIECGKNIVSGLLMTIHISKCIGDVETATNFFNKYGEVSYDLKKIYYMIKWPKVIKKQMHIDLKIIEKDGKQTIKINEYPSTPIGFIKSVVDRFEGDYNEITFKQWTKYYNPIKGK